MTILIGIVLGIIYIVQPIDAIRAPVEWMNSALVEYTGTISEWGLGFFGDSAGTQFVALLVAVAAPGIAGLAVNLIAPLGRVVRVVFSLAIVAVSLGAFGTLDWKQAALFSLVTSVVGGVLALASGAIMEAFAGFFSITLSFSQIRLLLSDQASPHLQELISYMSREVPALSGPTAHYLAVGIASIPVVLTGFWLLFRLSPTRQRI